MRVRRKPDARTQMVGTPAEAVVVDPLVGRAVVLNAVGTVCWELCAAPVDLDDLVDAVIERCEDIPAREVLRVDIEAWIGAMHRAGLLERVDAAP